MPNGPTAEDLLERIKKHREALPSAQPGATASSLPTEGEEASAPIPPASMAGDPQAQGLWSQIQRFKAKQQPQPPPSRLEAVWEGLKQGATDILYGGAQIGARMGPEIGDPYTTGEQQRGLQQRVDAATRAREQAYQRDPAVRAHPFFAGGGRLGGTLATSAPLALLPAGGATLPGRMAMGALTGAAGAATQPVAGGDYWAEKGRQVMAGGIGGAVLPGIATALAPRGAAATMTAAGVPLTSGMRLGMPQAERALSAFPLLRGVLHWGEGRAIDGFNRAVVNQALEPIGVTIPRTTAAGHDLMNAAHDAIEAAYNRVLPQTSLTQAGWSSHAPEIARIAGELPADLATPFTNILKNRLEDRFQGGVMSGRDLNRALREIGSRAQSFAKAPNTSTLGAALYRARDLLVDELAAQNPAAAQALQNTRFAFAMLARIEKAAGGKEAEGRFSPSDLLGALRTEDPSARHGAFVRGDTLLQAFAQAGRHALGKVTQPGAAVPSQTLQSLHNLVTLLGAGGGGGFVHGGPAGVGIGAAVGAALPYAARLGMGAAALPGRTPPRALPGLSAATGTALGEIEGEKLKSPHVTNPPP